MVDRRFIAGLAPSLLALALLDFDDQNQGFEAYYNFAMMVAADLTVDVQFQNSALDVDTAVILGMRFNLAL